MTLLGVDESPLLFILQCNQLCMAISQFKDNIIEVNTILKLNPGHEVKNRMLTEINFTTLVSVDKDIKDKKELEKIFLVKIPTEIYPTLYEIFIYLFKKAGVKNISITKEVNFEKMYNEKTKS